MQSVKARMRPALDANLSILATIGSNAPFVGLLGTVLGIIKAAHELTADTAQNNPNAVMSGVFEALVATAVGLFVAIPAVVAYNLFQRTRAEADGRSRFAGTLDSVDGTAVTRKAGGRAGAAPATGTPTRVAIMAGSISSSYGDDDEPISDINVTPLVDVTLVLLIVFMITVPAIVGSARVKVDCAGDDVRAKPTRNRLPLVFALEAGRSGTARAVSQRKSDRRGRRAEDVRRLGQAERRSAGLAVGRSEDIAYGEVMKVVDLLESLGSRNLRSTRGTSKRVKPSHVLPTRFRMRTD